MSNYPDTTYQADQRAPWNQPDLLDLFEGHNCSECVYFYKPPKDIDIGWCGYIEGYVGCTDYPCYDFEFIGLCGNDEVSD